MQIPLDLRFEHSGDFLHSTCFLLSCEDLLAAHAASAIDQQSSRSRMASTFAIDHRLGEHWVPYTGFITVPSYSCNCSVASSFKARYSRPAGMDARGSCCDASGLCTKIKSTPGGGRLHPFAH